MSGSFCVTCQNFSPTSPGVATIDVVVQGMDNFKGTVNLSYYVTSGTQSTLTPSPAGESISLAMNGSVTRQIQITSNVHPINITFTAEGTSNSATDSDTASNLTILNLIARRIRRRPPGGRGRARRRRAR